MKKVLIFDFDGTIADTESEFIKIFNKLADKHKFLKITEENRQRWKGYHPLKLIQEARIPLWKLPVLMSEGSHELFKTIETVKPISGISQELKLLKSRGYRLGILTSNSKENVHKFLQKHAIELFDFIYTGSSVFGKDKNIKSILKENDFSKDEVVYVGDEIRDIEATKKAGIQIISVTWGYGSKDALVKHKPDFLIEKPEALLQVVK